MQTVKTEKTAKVKGKFLGEWDSPITPKTVAEDTMILSQPNWDGEDVYWLEERPKEGRQVLVRLGGDGEKRTVTPDGKIWDISTYCVSEGVVYFWNRKDGAVYTQFALFPADPIPLTPSGKLGLASVSVLSHVQASNE